MKKTPSTLKKLVALLNDGEFHSGSLLGQTLNISRNAVWKHINQLLNNGILVETSKNKGYRLQQNLILLDGKNIKKFIWSNYQAKIKKLEIFNSIDSTNNYLKSATIEDLNSISICVAEQQSAGRGRLNRSWFSPFAANIYLSFSQYVNKDISELSGLSLIMGYAIVQALKDHGIEKDISIKWPNDILWQGKKLAGILMETRAECHGPMQIIIGIGLNVNMNTPIDNTINQPWTSIHHILGNYQDRNPLVASLINHVIKNLEEFDQQGFTADFIKRLQTYDHFYGKKITLTLGEESVSGIACGVNHLGHILLQHSDDRITAYSSADISILKNPSLCLTYLQ